MTEKNHVRVAWLASLAVSGLALSGCMSSPTYGTDKTANEQLFEDVSGIMSLAPKQRTAIDYKPRPELVKPAKGEVANLPAPQQSVASADNPSWPESPEQRRARLRAEAADNANNPAYESQVTMDGVLPQSSELPRPSDPRMASVEQRQEFQRRQREAKQGDPTVRKYLSEPPLDYRQAAASAPQGELGEDELKKERRLKREARKKGGSSWADLWPF